MPDVSDVSDAVVTRVTSEGEGETTKPKVTTNEVRDSVGLSLGITEGGKSKAGKFAGDDEIVLFFPTTEQKFRVKVDELKDQ